MAPAGPADPGHVPSRLIGDMLVADGLITAIDLQRALEAQARSGGMLGKQLLLSGAVTRLDLYGCLATQMNAPFVDLLANPPDPLIMAAQDPAVLIESEWIPYRWSGDTLIVATSTALAPADIEDIRLEFRAKDVAIVVSTDWDVAQVVLKYCRDRLTFNASEALAVRHAEVSAKFGPVPWQRMAFAVAAVLLVIGILFAASTVIIALLIIANIAFFVSVLFKVVTSIAGILARHDDHVVNGAVAAAGANNQMFDTPDVDLPMYTILVPAFRESNIIDLIIRYLGELDWPASKLQVLVLLEENDHETIEACKKARPPDYVRLLVVPAGGPQTKPRACNLGLMFAEGEYLVIYDAEDRPDPQQLRIAYAAFVASQKLTNQRPVICFQAELNYFNSRQNLLTRMFTLEYTSWFDGMLRGMSVFRLPLPLGGTSNHFRTDLLRKIGGWDPYNVTEDADLGLRAALEGFDVGTIDTTTLEEACSKIRPWIRQRTRWVKGYIITALVDVRFPIRSMRAAGPRGAFTLLGLIAGAPIMFLTYPLVWGMTIVTYLGVRLGDLTLPPLLDSLSIWNFIFGNTTIIVIGIITGWMRHGWRLAFFSVFNPVYWALHSWAAWRAVGQLIFSPHHWEKTPHGIDHTRSEYSIVR